MKITIDIDQETICKLIAEYALEKLGDSAKQCGPVKIYVKSKENYRLKTWELADIVATNDPDKYPTVKASVEVA